MHNAIFWDSELIRRYDRPGPRYTSYPTAVQFHDGVGNAELLMALHGSRRQRRPLSIYVHLPFCANICYYCACNKIVTKDHGRASGYLDLLEQELDLIAPQLSAEQQVEQLHLGGGTPTFLSHDELRRLMDMLRARFSFTDDGDFGIEIDPRHADWATMGLLQELGFNRISLGVQDLNPQVQAAINRRQSLEQISDLVDAARALHFCSINMDMIYGLPRQGVTSFTDSLAKVIALQPDRLALYNYAHLPERFKPQRRINATELPSPADKLAILQGSIEQLIGAGYRYIGMDHFALPDDELSVAQETGQLRRNFQGYTTHGHCDLIGFGVTAISQIGSLYIQNTSNLDDYQKALQNQKLPKVRGLKQNFDDRLRQAVIQQLICFFELDFATIETCFGIEFTSYFADAWPQLLQMAGDGLIRLSDQGIEVLPHGRLLVRSLCMLFDHYLAKVNRERFSRVI